MKCVKDTYEHGKRPTKEICLLEACKKVEGCRNVPKETYEYTYNTNERDIHIVYRTSAPHQGVQKRLLNTERDIEKRPTYSLSYISATSRGTKETYKHGKRHRKETYFSFRISAPHEGWGWDAKRGPWKRYTKETYEHGKRPAQETYEKDVEKRPTYSQAHLSTASRLRMKWTHKETYERDIEKRPMKVI